MVGLPSFMGISNTFNVADIFPFYPDDAHLHLEENSGSSSYLVGDNGAAPASIAGILVGLIEG